MDLRKRQQMDLVQSKRSTQDGCVILTKRQGMISAWLWLSTVGLSFAVRAAEPDWPQFRGPDLNPVGLNEALLDRWSKTENVEWVANIPGRGWSSPIVTGGKVFVTTAVTEGKSKQAQIGTT
jgi:hypothetical protein